MCLPSLVLQNEQHYTSTQYFSLFTMRFTPTCCPIFQFVLKIYWSEKSVQIVKVLVANSGVWWCWVDSRWWIVCSTAAGLMLHDIMHVLVHCRSISSACHGNQLHGAATSCNVKQHRHHKQECAMFSKPVYYTFQWDEKGLSFKSSVLLVLVG